jgi:hypothetical protein
MTPNYRAVRLLSHPLQLAHVLEHHFAAYTGNEQPLKEDGMTIKQANERAAAGCPLEMNRGSP